jgi:hypothetical protein
MYQNLSEKKTIFSFIKSQQTLTLLNLSSHPLLFFFHQNSFGFILPTKLKIAAAANFDETHF